MKWSPRQSKFSDIYFLHGKGGSPNGSVARLAEIIQRGYPNVDFYRPFLPHANPKITAEASFAAFQQGVVPFMQEGALLVGISMGGLVAARLQETNPEKKFHVFTVCSPTFADDLKLDSKQPNRVALYSSKDEVIADRTNWADYTDQNFDVPWLVHDVDLAKYAVSYFVTAYMRGLNLADEVATFLHGSEVGLEKVGCVNSATRPLAE